ncbi:MAG: DUF3109 family protein [Ignavibacteria bacterium]|nr:DUF3109 family protein [Ignavibacteria bacterium]
MSYIEMNIDERIFDLNFSCDLEKCKGACCTVEGTLGAPLNDSEIIEISSCYEYVRKYLNKENTDVIDREGFYVKYDGKLWMNNINDNDCVFSYYDGDIAKCGIQKAYNNGEIKFKKPISCELFPIRVYGEKYNELRYEKSYFCEDALEKGNREGISIFEYVKDAIIRMFGREFYNKYSKENI